MRAFVALEPPEGFAEDVAAMVRVLSAAVQGRFVPRQNYHVTLAFLGDIDEAQVREAMDAMDEACADAAAAPMRPDGLVQEPTDQHSRRQVGYGVERACTINTLCHTAPKTTTRHRGVHSACGREIASAAVV